MRPEGLGMGAWVNVMERRTPSTNPAESFPSAGQLTPSLRCRLVEDVVYWNISFLSGYT